MDFSKSRAPTQTCQIWPTFGELVLGCIEADFMRENVFCSIFEALQELRTFAPLQLFAPLKTKQQQEFDKKAAIFVIIQQKMAMNLPNVADFCQTCLPAIIMRFADNICQRLPIFSTVVIYSSVQANSAKQQPSARWRFVLSESMRNHGIRGGGARAGTKDTIE